MFAKRFSGACLALLLAATTFSPAVHAADAMASPEATLKDIEATLGSVPSFIKMLPPAALPGAWAEFKAMELGSGTALTAKEKSLISLAVAAQIPCQYCIWSDTNDAKRAGATDQEIAEAVTMSALTREWSTILNGLQIDFETFKKEMGGDIVAK